MQTQIKTFNDACKYLGLNPESCIVRFPDEFPAQHADAIVAHAKLVLIAQALNREANEGQDWVPDWTDDGQLKWYPWFSPGSPSGARFSFDDADCWFTYSNAGSRLCFKYRELAEYAGKQFEELYKTAFSLSNK